MEGAADAGSGLAAALDESCRATTRMRIHVTVHEPCPMTPWITAQQCRLRGLPFCRADWIGSL